MLQNQSNINAGENVAGRDLIITKNYFPKAGDTQISRLYAKFNAEEQNNPVVFSGDGFIEDLQHYLDRPARTLNRTLQQKLLAANREYLIDHALEAKERAAKRIVRFQTSQTAQEIFAYILGDIHTKFALNVSPLIASGASVEEVEAAIGAKVIEPISAAMEPSALGMNSSQIFAFLFYLGGNCHIQWD